MMANFGKLKSVNGVHLKTTLKHVDQIKDVLSGLVGKL